MAHRVFVGEMRARGPTLPSGVFETPGGRTVRYRGVTQEGHHGCWGSDTAVWNVDVDVNHLNLRVRDPAAFGAPIRAFACRFNVSASHTGAPCRHPASVGGRCYHAA